MSIFTKVIRVFKRENGKAPHDSPLRRGEVPDWMTTEGRSEAVSTVFCCVDLISKRLASMPVYFETLKNGIYVPDNSRRLNDCLNIEPDANQSAFDFWRAAVWEVLTFGNAYIVPVMSSVDHKFDRLVLCSRGSVSHDTTADVYHINDRKRHIVGSYYENEIVHLKGPSLPETPKVGQSVLSYARQTLGTIHAANAEMRNRFVNGGAVRGFITGREGGNSFTFDFDQEQGNSFAAKIERQINSKRQGVSYIPGELKFENTGMTAADMQFLETLKYNVREICRFFGVHPSFVFDDISSNYKSAENATAAFLDATLNPLLRNFESELHRKLVPRSLWHVCRVRFDREAMYATNIEARLNYQTKAMGIGVRTINEIRRADNMPPVQGGDVALVSANYRAVSELKSKTNGQND